MTKFCGSYEIVGAIIVWTALAFVVLALLAAAIEVYKAARKPVNLAGGDGRAAALPAITAIIEALKGLVTALTGAPLWLGLLICGVLLFYVPASAISALYAPSADAKHAAACPAK